ncbi:MAG: substrate-binding periplasmic protein [Aliihoeflea sp.]
MLKPILTAVIGFLCTGAQAETRIGICYRADAAPFSYVGTDGQPAGYSIDICRAAAEMLGRSPVMVEVKSNDRFDMLGTQRACDMLCEATSITMKRRESLEFSLITFLTGTALLYPSDLLEYETGGQSITVGYLRGTTIADHSRAGTLIGGQLADFTFKPFDDHEAAASALAAGTIDSYIADREILQEIVNKNAALLQTHRVSRESITYEPYAIAVRMGSDEIRIALDRVLVQMFRSGTIAGLLARHVPDRQFDPMLDSLFAIQSLPE